MMTSDELKNWANIGLTHEIQRIEAGVISRSYADGLTIEQIEGSMEKRRILLLKMAELDALTVMVVDKQVA